MKSASYLIKIINGNKSQQIIWHTEKPLALGRPFRWILECDELGISLRELVRPTKKPAKPRIIRIDQATIIAKKAVQIEKGLSIQIIPKNQLNPVYQHHGESKEGRDLILFERRNGQAVRSFPVIDTFQANILGEALFSLKQAAGGTYEISAHKEGMRIHTAKQNKALPKNQKLSISANQLKQLTLNYNTAHWTFISAGDHGYTEPQRVKLSFDDEQFNKIARNTGIGSLLIFALLLLIPKSEVKKDEVLPEQFAKIILKPQSAGNLKSAASTAQSKAKEVASSSKANTQQSNAQKKTSVVQVMRSSNLQAAASQLLKGGMTKLLEQSDLVSGVSNSKQMRQSLGVGVTALAGAAGITDAVNQKQGVAVATLGGEGTGNGSNKSVGYGKGERAGVQGQGKSFVKVDTEGSSVDEGLTREEVGEVIHKHMSEIRYCYEASMIKNASVEGKLILAFVVESSGSVKNVEVKESSINDSSLDDCISRRLRNWQFPKPRGGVDVAISYPFIFKSLGG